MRAPFTHRLRRAAVLVSVAVVGTSCLLGLGAVARGGSPVASASTLPSSIALEGQTPAVVRSTSGLRLAASVRSPLPAQSLGVSITLFSKAQFLDTFRQTLTGNTAGLGVMSSSAGSLPLSTFGASGDGGVFSIFLPVSAPGLGGPTPRPPRRGTLLQVSCAAGGCAGVYPLQVSLTDLNEGVTLDTFTTYLVLDPPGETAQSTPLRFSWVMTVGSRPAITPNGFGKPDPADLAVVQELGSVLSSGSAMPLSLQIVPQFVHGLSLAPRTSASSSALGVLRNLANSTNAEIIPDTFTSLDLPALGESGLAADTTTQLDRGRQVLQRDLGTMGRVNEFAPATPIGLRALARLAGSGVNTVVLPSSGVVPVAPSEEVYAALSPFVVEHSGVEAVASDAGLESHLSGPGNSILRAEQLLANLAELFFQVPDARKGVALLSPYDWKPAPGFLETVLGGLAGNPLVKGATVSQLFASVPPGAANPSDGTLRTRAIAAGPVSPLRLLPSRAIAQAKAQLHAITSSTPSAVATTARLGDGLLMSETAGLALAARGAYLRPIAGTLQEISNLILLPSGHTITVTSLNAKVPISIVSKATVPLVVQLSASSPDLAFVRRHTWFVHLLRGTNIVDVQVTARTSGDFPLDLRVLSPDGSYSLVTGRLTIRSTAISGVAVAISVGALAFLVIWWSRSIVTRRRRRHRERGAALAAGVTSGAGSDGQ